MATQETARWINLEEVVKEYISQAELNMAHFRRLWNIAFRGLEELSFNVYQTPKTFKIDVLPNKTAYLPQNYTHICKVGVHNSDGEIATLYINKNLSRYASESADRVDMTTDSPSNLSNIRDYLYLNFESNGSMYNLQGIGSSMASAGEVTIDEEKGMLLFDSGFPYEYIIVECMVSPREDENYKIPIQVKEALIAWVAWKDIEYKRFDRRFQDFSKERLWRAFVREKKRAKLKINPLYLWEANEVSRRNEILAVK